MRTTVRRQEDKRDGVREILTQGLSLDAGEDYTGQERSFFCELRSGEQLIPIRFQGTPPGFLNCEAGDFRRVVWGAADWLGSLAPCFRHLLSNFGGHLKKVNQFFEPFLLL